MTWPVPSQPGVGHLISLFSGLEGSRDCGEKAVGRRLGIWRGRSQKERKTAEDASLHFSSETGRNPSGLEGFFVDL